MSVVAASVSTYVNVYGGRQKDTGEDDKKTELYIRDRNVVYYHDGMRRCYHRLIAYVDFTFLARARHWIAP